MVFASAVIWPTATASAPELLLDSATVVVARLPSAGSGHGHSPAGRWWLMVVGGQTPVVKISELERLGLAVEPRFSKV